MHVHAHRTQITRVPRYNLKVNLFSHENQFTATRVASLVESIICRQHSAVATGNRTSTPPRRRAGDPVAEGRVHGRFRRPRGIRNKLEELNLTFIQSVETTAPLEP